jgi:hypothetical protein
MKAVALLLALAVGPAASDKDKPSISVKASPAVAFSPARIVVSVDIKGGPNDYEDFYCPSIEWAWGDGTYSNETADCEPYQAGKSEIKRHFTTTRVYNLSGDFRVEFRLKKKDKTIAVGSTIVKIRPGLGDIGGGGL